jgi:uncharacterized coiled-coil DUF342 family protein
MIYKLSINLSKKEIYKRVYEYEALKQEIERLHKEQQLLDEIIIKESVEDDEILDEALAYHNPTDIAEIERLNKHVISAEMMIKGYCKTMVEQGMVLAKAREALVAVFREKPTQESMEYAESVLAEIDKAVGE